MMALFLPNPSIELIDYCGSPSSHSRHGAETEVIAFCALVSAGIADESLSLSTTIGCQDALDVRRLGRPQRPELAFAKLLGVSPQVVSGEIYVLPAQR
jgi:hypothetical protein